MLLHEMTIFRDEMRFHPGRPSTTIRRIYFSVELPNGFAWRKSAKVELREELYGVRRTVVEWTFCRRIVFYNFN